MSETTVRTEEELKKAVESQFETINIENPELVTKLKNMERLKKCAPWAVGLALAAVVAYASTPVTGPAGPVVGHAAFMTAAAATGLSTTALAAIAVLSVLLGLTCFFAIFNGYDLEVEGEASAIGEDGIGNLKGRFRLKKRG